MMLRATPDMDTRDCEYVNARIAALIAALRACLLRDDIANDEIGDTIRAALAAAEGK